MPTYERQSNFQDGVPADGGVVRRELDIIGASVNSLYNGWIDVRESWSYSSADSPTFVISVPADATQRFSVGMRVKLTQTTVKYFIVTAVSSTTLTVYGGTDYTLANAAISAIFVSSWKAPLGFPLDPTKWTVTVTDSSDRSQATPTANTWYNLGSVTISLPIGAWSVDYKVIALFYKANAAVIDGWVTLSTGTNTESDSTFTTIFILESVATSGGANQTRYVTLMKQGYVVVSSKTSYYLNMATSIASMSAIGYWGGSLRPTIIRAVCAYL